MNRGASDAEGTTATPVTAEATALQLAALELGADDLARIEEAIPAGRRGGRALPPKALRLVERDRGMRWRPQHRPAMAGDLTWQQVNPGGSS